MDSAVLGHYRALVGDVLNVPLCVTWIEDLSPVEVLVAAGRRDDGAGDRTYEQTVQAAYDAMPAHAGAALAGRLGRWTVLVEPNGFQGSRPEVLSGLSNRGRALSAFWNGNGDGQLVYAEHGQVLAVLDLFDAENLDDLPGALSAWEELTEEDDLRVAALVLGETVTGERLSEEWLEAEHPSGMLDASAGTEAPLSEQERQEHLAYLASDPRVADLIANPERSRAREIAALVAETACELGGLDVPLAGRVLAALTPQAPASLLAELRAEVRLLGQETLARAETSDVPAAESDRLHAQYKALNVLEAALAADAVSAARDAIWRVGMFRLGDHGGRRVGALMDVLRQIEAQG